MFKFIKQAFATLLSFSGSLAGIVNTPGYTKCLFLNNKQCTTQPTLINLNPSKYIEGLSYYPFAVKQFADSCTGSCNALYDLSS